MTRFPSRSLSAALLVTLIVSGCRSSVQPTQVVVETLVKSTTSWDGEDLPAYGTGDPEVTILKITIPPGVALPEHRHPMMNAGVLLEGTLEVNTEDGDQTILHAGDGLVEVVNEWHHGRNPGPKPAVIFVVYAGTVGQPLSIKQENSNADD